MLITRLNAMTGIIVLFPFYLFNVCLDHNNSTDPVTQVRKTLDERVNAWNSRDLAKSKSYYWDSAEMLWISKAGVIKGYKPVSEDFEQALADTSKMGIYSYESLHIEKISGNSVYFVIRWKIVSNGQEVMSGVSSQIWKRIDTHWVITAEHAS